MKMIIKYITEDTVIKAGDMLVDIHPTFTNSATQMTVARVTKKYIFMKDKSGTENKYRRSGSLACDEFLRRRLAIQVKEKIV